MESGAKFYIYGGGRWRELDISRGDVAGWGRVRFLRAERGRLVATRRSAVLRQLAHDNVLDGPPLERQRTEPRRRAPLLEPCYCHCNHAHNRVEENNNVGAEKPRSVSLRSAGVQTEDDAPSTTTRVCTVASPVPRGSPSQEAFHEITVYESDVDTMRRYLARHQPGFDARRFDTDDQYKVGFFYSLNPLVSVERCARIADMHARRTDLQKFAAQLGLRSVSEASEERPPPRVTRAARASASNSDRTEGNSKEKKTRSDPDRARKPTASGPPATSVASDSDTEKENFKPRRSLAKPRNDPTASDRAAIVSDSDTDKANFEKKPRRKLAKTTKPPPPSALPPRAGATNSDDNKENEEAKSSKRSNPGRVAASTSVAVKERVARESIESSSRREYSSLEDHCIVTWLCSGNRAHLVNGNSVWRALEAAWARLTGRARSWHSLRNRYLRYLLPALERMRLEPRLQRRLRIAAAEGCLKARRFPPRRNSMFARPTRGASSRAPLVRVRSSSSSSSPPAPERRSSPTYSEITRRWAERHRGSSSSRRSSPAPDRKRSPAAPAPSRSLRNSEVMRGKRKASSSPRQNRSLRSSARRSSASPPRKMRSSSRVSRRRSSRSPARELRLLDRGSQSPPREQPSINRGSRSLARELRLLRSGSKSPPREQPSISRGSRSLARELRLLRRGSQTPPRVLRSSRRGSPSPVRELRSSARVSRRRSSSVPLARLNSCSVRVPRLPRLRRLFNARDMLS